MPTVQLRVLEMLLTTGKTLAMRILLAFLLLPACALGANSVVNMSHYDLMRPDFAGMKKEGVAGVIHEATFPRQQRDTRYAERQRAAFEAGLLWGAYHFGDGTNPVGQADHFLDAVTDAQLPSRLEDPAKPRSGVLLVLDFEKNGHYPGGSMSVAQAVAFVERIKERTGKYPGLYGSEYRLRQMLNGQAPLPRIAKYFRDAGSGSLTIIRSRGIPRPGAAGISGNTVAMAYAICGHGACIRNRSLTSQRLSATFSAATTPSCEHSGARTPGILRDENLDASPQDLTKERAMICRDERWL